MAMAAGRTFSSFTIYFESFSLKTCIMNAGYVKVEKKTLCTNEFDNCFVFRKPLETKTKNAYEVLLGTLKKILRP